MILAATMRHPCYPTYVPLARANPSLPQIMSTFESSIERILTGISSYLYMDECPEEIRPTLNGLIKTRLLKHAHEQNVNVAVKLTRLKELNHSPWQHLDHGVEPIPEKTNPVTKNKSTSSLTRSPLSRIRFSFGTTSPMPGTSL